MCAAPPRHCGDLSVLDPGKQQQEAQNRFDIDGDQKSVLTSRFMLPPEKRGSAPAGVSRRKSAYRRGQKKRECVSNCEDGPAVMVAIVFPSFRVFDESAL